MMVGQGRRVDMGIRVKVSSAPEAWTATHMSALASMANLSLLEIVTRPQGCLETYTKVMRGTKVLYEGTSSRSLGRERGTTVIVRDLFHNVSFLSLTKLRFQIPVRQAALAFSSSLISACKQAVQVLVLVRPDVKWTLWEEAAIGSSVGGPSLKKLLSVNGVGQAGTVRLA
jgi:DNA mismatch repair protein MLH3